MSNLEKNSLVQISPDKLDLTIQIFKHMALYHRLLGDQIRETSYLMAVSTLTDLLFNRTFQLNKIFDAPNIGKKSKEKILQIIKTDTFPEYERLRKSNHIKSMINLQDIYGIGPAMAKRLYNRGIRNISDLIKIKDTLPEPVQIGIKYRNHLRNIIPQNIIDKFMNFIKKAAKNISHSNYNIDVLLCGSARRGVKPTDLDLLVISDSGQHLQSIMFELFSFDDVTNKAVLADGDTKYMAIIEIDNEIFKLDVRAVKSISKSAAMLYFTGPRLFNIWMRSRAIVQGKILNEYGLFKGVKLIPTDTEKQIFDNLNIKYLTPKQRSKFWKYI